MFFFSHETKTKPVLFGKQWTKECPKCHKTAKFIECELTEGFTAYGVFKIFEDNKRVMRCQECEQVFKLDEVTDPKVDEAKRKEAEAEAERQKAQEEREELERQTKKKEKEAAVDKDLEELKRQLGK